VSAPIKEWTAGVEVEASARKQLEDTASLPIVWPHLAVMPDVHWGMGSTVGSVVPTRGAIIPACVGVDLGCGMAAIRTSLDSRALGDNGQAVRDAIEAAVPHGRTDDGGPNDRGAWRDVPSGVARVWTDLEESFRPLAAKNPKLDTKRQPFQLGTLGTGNHFIEVSLDEADRVWVMLHSGSRGIGNRIGSTYIAAAKKRCETDGIALPNKDLAWLPEGTSEFDDYVAAVGWAQRYAKENRDAMLSAVAVCLIGLFPNVRFDHDAVSCHHNYVNRERHFGEDLWITRKGAVSARKGELGLIPGAMGRKSFVVRGKGNADSFHTCSHGAGRRMSRGAAKKAITLEQHAEDTAGVFCRKDVDVLDESPRAYKDVDAVMAAQVDLVDVVHTLRAVVCVKG
jgi:tRNA-splicing ligase RtcB (3'-phosphate/5'-hydroxy nucleic acid ligase)